MKYITISYALLPLLFCISSLPILGEEVTETRAKDKEAIVSHVMGIAGNVISLMKEDEKTEEEIGANIVGLFGNILACIFAASKRSNVPFDLTQEEIDKLFAGLDQEIIQAVHKAVVTRAQQLRSL